MKKTKERLGKAHAKYKKNSDARQRKQSEVIHEDYYVYLRVYWMNPKDHSRKLLLVAEGPYKVTNINKNTVVIEKTEQFVENVSRSRVVLAP